MNEGKGPACYRSRCAVRAKPQAINQFENVVGSELLRGPHRQGGQQNREKTVAELFLCSWAGCGFGLHQAGFGACRCDLHEPWLHERLHDDSPVSVLGPGKISKSLALGFSTYQGKRLTRVSHEKS
jgi:hypothetical protein